MMTPANMVSFLLLPLALSVVGCSTSEFGGASGTGGGKQETKKRPDADVDDGNDGTPGDVETDTASGNAVPSHDGAEQFNNRSDTGASEHKSDSEVAEGCRLPKNVKSTIASTSDRAGGKSIFGLLGWGGGGGATATKMELNNLDIRDCSWFEQVKGDPNVKFVYIFQKRGLGLQAAVQSYAEPAVNVSNQTICANKAIDVTRSIGNAESGTLQCALIPRDNNGQVIEN